ncbi:hypothetical protein [Mammaliicoccus sp. P-M59]|uniref:hypothetical protein n=1 Tax=Mammaliicoccus sp. P-M59 TaxID=2898718 RepID=UPI001EFB98BE|nr:hypothetical protein [Mammaliicoccus sp. P-M59]
MNIKIRSESGKEYFAIYNTENLEKFVKMIIKTNQMFLKVNDSKGRKGILKISSIESLTEIKEDAQ